MSLLTEATTKNISSDHLILEGQPNLRGIKVSPKMMLWSVILPPGTLFSLAGSQFHFESTRNLRHPCCFCGKGFKAEAPASKIVSVNVPQRLRRLLLLGVALPLYWLPAAALVVLWAALVVLCALLVLWAALVVLESEESSDKNRGLPAQRSHRYRRANCYTSIY